jgi:hypothetical protein
LRVYDEINITGLEMSHNLGVFEPVFWIRIQLDPPFIFGWDLDPHSESGSGFQIHMSKNRL